METVKILEDIKNLKNNKIIGKPKINNSNIIFKGYNNILFCEDNLELNNSTISFEGNNSIIYLSFGKYPITLIVRHNSTVFIGKDNKIISKVIINVQENQNFIMGDDGIIGSGVNIRLSDIFPIYNSKTKNRINFTKSVFIGDHVWLDFLSYLSGGVQIGSGAIIGNHAYIPPYSKIPSNSYVLGNPGKIINKNIFFTKENTSNYTPSETNNSSTYKSDVFIYKTNEETLDLNKINMILNQLSSEDTLEFISKLFVKNKRKNRFSI